MIEEQQKLNRYLHAKLYGVFVPPETAPDYYGDANITLAYILGKLPGEVRVTLGTTGQSFRVELRDRFGASGYGISNQSPADALAMALSRYMDELAKYAPTPDSAT